MFSVFCRYRPADAYHELSLVFSALIFASITLELGDQSRLILSCQNVDHFCDQAQGHYFSRPLCPVDFEGKLREEYSLERLSGL